MAAQGGEGKGRNAASPFPNLSARRALPAFFHRSHGLFRFFHAAIGVNGLHAGRDVVHRLAFVACRVEHHVELLGEAGAANENTRTAATRYFFICASLGGRWQLVTRLRKCSALEDALKLRWILLNSQRSPTWRSTPPSSDVEIVDYH